MEGTRRRRAAAADVRKSRGRSFTALAYLCALGLALFLREAMGPWRHSGLQKEYRPYLVLELPAPREWVGQGPLAGGSEELPPPHQKQLERRKKSLPEYVGRLRGYPWEGNHFRVRQDGVNYEVYYIPAEEGTTRVPIPVGYEYLLSGDGEDGFIVTIWKKRQKEESP